MSLNKQHTNWTQLQGRKLFQNDDHEFHARKPHLFDGYIAADGADQ